MKNMEIKLSDFDTAELMIAMYGIKDGAKRALYRGFSKGNAAVKSAMVETARAEYNVKLAEARSHIKTRLSWTPLESSAWSTGQPISLTGFTGTRKTNKGLSVDLKKSTGRKIIPHAFLASMKSGHKGGYLRQIKNGKRVGRLPIEERFGPRLENLYAKESVNAVLRQKGWIAVKDEVARQIDVILGQYK